VQLTEDHIAYIIKDLHYRGIVAEEVENQLVDHICAAVEARIDRGEKFIDAYHGVLKEFGHTSGLRKIQEETLRQVNHKSVFMLKNYLTIAFRQLKKQGFYSVINIVGLAVGIAACLLIVLFITDELSYDRYSKNSDRIYRVNNDISFGGNAAGLAVSAAPVGHAMQQDYPEVESTVRFRYSGAYLVKTADGNDNIRENNVAWTDSTFFRIFDIPVLEGNPDKALAEPEAVAISRRMAEKYFPGKSALGGTIILDNVRRAHVTAVYENIPRQSHFHFDILISLAGNTWPYARSSQSTAFVNENWNTYLLLRPGTNKAELEAKFPKFLVKYMEPSVRALLGKDFTIKKMEEAGDRYVISLMALPDIHLHSALIAEFEPNGNIEYIYIFGLVAIFILGIASINFMNLSTARSGGRAKEVGIRKVMGSLRKHLVRQFLMESILVTSFSSLAAVVLAYLALPFFNALASTSLQLPVGDIRFYLILGTFAVFIGILAGLYPSFFLSAFKPVNVLKGKFGLGMRSRSIRGALVVFQFTITMLLIVGALTVNRQLNFIQNKKLGFDKDQIIVVKDGYALRPRANVQAFKNEVMQLASIENGTICGYLPVDNSDSQRSTSAWWAEGKDPSTENLVSAQTWGAADYDYIKTFGMKIKSGRDFSPKFGTDSSAVILNEEAVARLGLGEDAVGKKILTFADGANTQETKTKIVIGVVENFHFSSLKEGIKPLVLEIPEAKEWNDGSISFKFKGNDAKEVIREIEHIWRKRAPGQPFLYAFLDEDFQRTYQSEQKLGSMFNVFASLAILIACLGLFALTAFITEQRSKEIGIRKVLGATVGNIVMLLSKEFSKLILIAFVIAVPVAIYGVNWWLNGYTFKTEIGALIYAFAGLLVLGISWLTMSFQSFKAASTDPVKSLRSE
jgi:putative ABC transport system permease protein